MGISGSTLHVDGVRRVSLARGEAAYDQLEQTRLSWTFQCMVDILLKLRRPDLIFAEVPMVLRYDMKQCASKMRVGRTIGNTLLLMVNRRLGR